MEQTSPEHHGPAPSGGAPEHGLMCSSRSGWKSSQAVAASEASGTLSQSTNEVVPQPIPEELPRDVPQPAQLPTKPTAQYDVNASPVEKTQPSMGGPSHQYGVGAPPNK